MERPRRHESHANRTPHYVDKQAVINALSTKAQIVGLTGKVSKTIEYQADKWYGDKTYKLAATGTFKLGVSYVGHHRHH
jgi:hypothetical protein